MDRTNDMCMHYHDLDNQWIEGLLERRIYSRGLGKGINMRLSYPHRDITSEGCCRRHRWCGLGFCLEDRVYLFQCISHPNIRRYGTLVVGWLCLDHSLWVVGCVGDEAVNAEDHTTFCGEEEPAYRWCKTEYAQRERGTKTISIKNATVTMTTTTTFTKGYKVTLYSDWLRATVLYAIYINSLN